MIDPPTVAPGDQGGDPACWLDRVCDGCGRLLEAEDDVCPVCRKAGSGT